MRVLVTGGAGYIGSLTCQALRDAGHRPIALDRLSTGAAEAVADLPLHVVDIADRAAVEGVLLDEAIEAIVHLAGSKSVAESFEDPAAYFRNNVAGSLALLEAADRCEVRRFVFSSSAAVYGMPDRLPVAETAPARPSTPYGETKLMVEQMLAWFDRCRGLRYVSLRYFNAAGAGPDGSLGEDWSLATNLVPVVMRAALGRSGPVQIFGTDYPTPDGTAIRDYIHVVDLADAHVAALDHLRAGSASTVLNVGTGGGHSVREVIAMTEEVSGVRVPFEEVGRRPGDPAAVWADVSKIRRELGWEARHGLGEILSSAWAWHALHPEGFAAPVAPAT